jgi:hypothetical protein
VCELPEEDVEGINLVRLFDFSQKNLDMLLKDIQITDAIFDELWPYELAGVVPECPIGREYTIPEEGVKILVELLSFAVVLDLRSWYEVSRCRNIEFVPWVCVHCVARIALMFSGSTVRITLSPVPASTVCPPFPYSANIFTQSS